VVSIKADGRIFVEESMVEESALDEVFKNASQKNSQTLVVIRADRDVSHGRVVQVMDSARRMGLTRIAIATVQKARR
jgi:biopolymer transport protein ExbD